MTGMKNHWNHQTIKVLKVFKVLNVDHQGSKSRQIGSTIDLLGQDVILWSAMPEYPEFLCHMTSLGLLKWIHQTSTLCYFPPPWLGWWWERQGGGGREKLTCSTSRSFPLRLVESGVTAVIKMANIPHLAFIPTAFQPSPIAFRREGRRGARHPWPKMNWVLPNPTAGEHPWLHCPLGRRRETFSLPSLSQKLIKVKCCALILDVHTSICDLHTELQNSQAKMQL